MPFETLERHCRLPSTHFTEQGKTVSLEPEQDETVRFFHIDNHAFRSYFQVANVCDLLIEYQRETFALLLFIELKGKNLRDAEQQIVGAVKAVRTCLEGQWALRALVVASGVSPKRAAAMQRRIKRATSVTLYFKSLKRGTLSLRPFIKVNGV